MPIPTPTNTPTPTATPTAEEITLNTVASSPKAMVYADWGWNRTLSFDEISVTVDIHNDIEYRGDNGLYLIGCTAFSIGENGAYFGLQTDVNTGPAGGWRGIGKGGIFSVWDVPNLKGVRGPDGAWIEAGDYEGSFLSVRSPYEWGAGRYTMRVSAEETDEAGRWFGYYVNDTWIGSLRFAPGARIQPLCYTPIEVYGADVKPSDIPYWKVSMTAPVADGVPARRGSTFYPDNVESLRNALITVKDGVVTFEVGLDYIPETPEPAVQVIYAIPSDREENPLYADVVRNAILHVQDWYAEQLDGLTFAIKEPTPLTCAIEEAAEYYEGKYGWDRVVESVQHCAPVDYSFNQYVWAIYIDVEFDCDGNGELGAGGGGITIVHGGDLEGLVNPETYSLCGTEPRSEYGWIGGLAHELGHALGLPHPPGCEEGLPSCDYDALMWAGLYWDYPETYLTDEDKAILQTSPFLKHRIE